MKHIKAGCSSVNTCNPSVPMGKSGEGQKQDDPRSSKGSYPAIHNKTKKRPCLKQGGRWGRMPEAIL